MNQVISLSPTMTKRMGFEHDLLDTADTYKMTMAEIGTNKDRFILGHMWLVKDLVSRFRAHWPETRRMTDDLCSTGLEALTEYANNNLPALWAYNPVQAFLHGRMRDYINDNRSTFSASRATNQRREQDDAPLEYNFALTLNESLVQEDDYSPSYVDILDAIETLAETDREHMHTLIMTFLNTEHQIDEATLTDEERAAIARLSQIGRDLL